MKTKALIMAKGVSERVPDKNIRPFAGASLLEIKIKQMLRIPSVDGVVVNSDSDRILEIAGNLGAEAIRRDPYYCTQEINCNELYAHLAETFPADIIAVTNTTSPMITDKTMDAAIRCFLENMAEYDSLHTAHPVREFLWLDGRPMNYSEDKKPRSQDLPNILNLNAALQITTRDAMIKNRNYVGKNPYIYQIDRIEGTDIDEMLDFEVAEFLFKKLGNAR
jgi:CMP-N-acetylneuraminic acid synthetase